MVPQLAFVATNHRSSVILLFALGANPNLHPIFNKMIFVFRLLWWFYYSVIKIKNVFKQICIIKCFNMTKLIVFILKNTYNLMDLPVKEVVVLISFSSSFVFPLSICSFLSASRLPLSFSFSL